MTDREPFTDEEYEAIGCGLAEGVLQWVGRTDGEGGTAMDDVNAFLQARLDEIEAAARAIMPGAWAFAIEGNAEASKDKFHASQLLNHIVRQDPERVLREVEATRRTIQLYERRQAELERNRQAATELATDIDREERGEEVVGSTGTRGRAIGREFDYLTSTMLDLGAALKFRAAVWMDHEDYRPEWVA